ncbi:putative integrase [Shigella sonnei]|nr:putative integrase [Shigella sonnei]
MTTLFRKEYPQKSRATEFLFLILFIVLMIPISPLIFVWAIGKIIEPVTELYTDVVWASFNTLHNKINPYRKTDMATLTKKERAWLNELQEVLDRCPVVSSCRDCVLSPWLLHHHHAKGTAKRGGMVKPATLTVAFKKARDSVDYNWRANGTPPSFHEQRSLSERLFREQGVDTKILLGHSNQKMTDIYNDVRGKEWKKLVI